MLEALKVALYARAWVEIRLTRQKQVDKICRPLREGVGRNPLRVARGCLSYSRPLREGVGRNLYPLVLEEHAVGRPLREGVGRNVKTTR